MDRPNEYRLSDFMNRWRIRAMTRNTFLLLFPVLCALISVVTGMGLQPGYAADNGQQGLAATRINPQDGAEMILIPAGNFLMGGGDTDKYAALPEKPQRTVSLVQIRK
jgi:formylglycine-generating enzyme required for sulfatase activity